MISTLFFLGPVRGINFHANQPLFVSGGDDYKIKVGPLLCLMLYEFNNCAGCIYSRYVPGISWGLNCEQPVPRQYNVFMTGFSCNQAMSPHGVFRHTSHWVNKGDSDSGRKTLTNRPKMYRKLLDPMTKVFQGPEHTSTVAKCTQSAIPYQYHWLEVPLLNCI